MVVSTRRFLLCFSYCEFCVQVWPRTCRLRLCCVNVEVPHVRTSFRQAYIEWI